MLDSIFRKKKEQTKVLVVDDGPNMLHVLTKFLQRQGHDVIVAANGKEGLEKAIAEEPDIILLDLTMPIMDGKQVLRHIRNHSVIKDTPVIMLTAHSEPEHVNAIAEHEITDYITKPFDYEYLLQKINEALEDRRKQRV
ncbi:MAG: response regulator [Sedimentisphaerales bacterium]|nr:response regulator [Sedimentisphaerales bacterium]